MDSMTMRYAPDVFFQPDAERAIKVILTAESGLTPEQRFVQETEFLAAYLKDLPRGLTVDYGSGIGRLAKVLDDRPVLGVDISPSMRWQADQYVQRKSFGTVDPAMFYYMVQNGLRVPALYAVWALQHIPQPEIFAAIETIGTAMEPGGRFLVVSMGEHGRAIPVLMNDETVRVEWVNDGLDVDNLIIDAGFHLVHREPMPPALCEGGAHMTLWEIG